MNFDAVRVTAIVPTFNRCELFARAVESVLAQTVLPQRFIILNNGSADGTAQYLQNLKNDKSRLKGMVLEVIDSPVNLGASEGMRFLFQKAFSQDPKPHWVWVMDDDAMATPSALKELLSTPEALDPDAYILESVIVDDHGHWTEANRPAIFKSETFEFLGLPANACDSNEPVAVNTGGYCGLLIRSQSFQDFGFPRSEFYLWYDDIEYVMRVSLQKKVFLVPRARIIHSAQALVPHKVIWPFSGPLPEVPLKLLWRYYYLNRNWLWMAKQWMPPARFALFWAKHMTRNFAAPVLLGQSNIGLRWSLVAKAGADALLNRLGPRVLPPQG